MEDTAQNRKGQRQFTGWHMLFIMIGFFAVVIGANLYMAISADRAWTGLVVKNSYVASQEYNAKLAASRAQHAMGWSSNIEIVDGEFIFMLLDGEQKPLSAQEVIVQINRPVGTKDDVQLILQQREDGKYSANIDLGAGVWKVHLIANFADQPAFEHYYKLVIEE